MSRVLGIVVAIVAVGAAVRLLPRAVEIYRDTMVLRHVDIASVVVPSGETSGADVA